jgi:hypothetical protein
MLLLLLLLVLLRCDLRLPTCLGSNWSERVLYFLLLLLFDWLFFGRIRVSFVFMVMGGIVLVFLGVLWPPNASVWDITEL